jgi:hypothetical protein
MRTLSPNTSEHLVVTGSPDRIAGLSPRKVAELRAVRFDTELQYRTTLARIHAEFSRYLDSLTREAREGKNLLPAADFARLLRFRGVLDVLDKFAAPGQSLPSLEPRITQLLDVCGDHFRGGRVDAKYALSDIAEINRKLDLLLSEKARPVSDAVIPLPALLVKTEPEEMKLSSA